MADDVVELAVLGDIVVAEVGLLDLQVLEAQFLHLLLTGIHLNLGVVEAEELAVGVPEGQRDEVAAGGAAQLQHAAFGNRGRVHAEQAADERQTLGVRLDEATAVIRNLIVGIDGGGGRDR